MLRIDVRMIDESVLRILQAGADSDGYCYKRQQIIADEIGCHVNTVKRSTKRLKAAGLIEIFGKTYGVYYRIVKNADV